LAPSAAGSTWLAHARPDFRIRSPLSDDLLLDVDFFRHAGEPLEEVRARLGVTPKSQSVLELDPLGALKLP
jgi:hypothetical protein